MRRWIATRTSWTDAHRLLHRSEPCLNKTFDTIVIAQFAVDDSLDQRFPVHQGDTGLFAIVGGRWRSQPLALA